MFVTDGSKAGSDILLCRLRLCAKPGLRLVGSSGSDIAPLKQEGYKAMTVEERRWSRTSVFEVDKGS